jgi:hypothetical protein
VNHSIALINHPWHHLLEDPPSVKVRIGFYDDVLLSARAGLRVSEGNLKFLVHSLVDLFIKNVCFHIGLRQFVWVANLKAVAASSNIATSSIDPESHILGYGLTPPALV